IAQVAPASAAAISPSGNGKNASLATALPLSESPDSFAFQTAIREASTRDIWPAPIPIVRSALAYTMAFDFTCLTTRQPNNIAFSSAFVGRRLVTTFGVSSPSTSASWTNTPPQTERRSVVGLASFGGTNN